MPVFTVTALRFCVPSAWRTSMDTLAENGSDLTDSSLTYAPLRFASALIESTQMPFTRWRSKASTGVRR